MEHRIKKVILSDGRDYYCPQFKYGLLPIWFNYTCGWTGCRVLKRTEEEAREVIKQSKKQSKR